VAGNDYLTQIVTRILIYGILVLSVEMCWGQTGIFTFGQAALFGIGGYVVGLVTTKSTVTDIGKLLLVAVIAGALVGLILGIFPILWQARWRVIRRSCDSCYFIYLRKIS